MTMTIQQAEQLVNAQDTPQPPDVGPPGGDTGSQPDWEQDSRGIWYDANSGSPAPQWLQDKLNNVQDPAKAPVWHAPTTRLPGYWEDPVTHEQYDSAGNLLNAPPRLPGTGTFMDWIGPPQQNPDSPLYWGPGGANGYTQGYGAATGYGAAGTDHYATDASIAQQIRDLEEKKREFGLTFEESKREFDLQNQLANQQAQQGYLQNRATTGLNLGQFAQSLANDQYQRALDPGNYPAYLAASAGLPQGAGSPISALIGQGTQIQSPEGANPLADPRFQNLMSNLYEYAQPGALQTVQGIAASHGGQLPQAFYDYTHTQNPNVPAHALGGTQYLNGPTVGIPANQLIQGQDPQFIAGEAGTERLDFTPMHQHPTNGMPTPHAHDGGHAKHEHMGNVIQYADGGTLITGTGPTIHQLQAAWNAYHPNDQHPDNVYTPAEGTAISLGKALQPLGYVPSYLIQQLNEGRTPTPGSVDEATLNRLPPSLRALLQAQIRSAVGGAGVMDYNAELGNQQIAGVNSGRTYTQYQ